MPLYTLVLISTLCVTWKRDVVLFMLVVWLCVVSYVIGLITPNFKDEKDSSILDDEIKDD